jgi:three-Cys-motif partner protein
MSKPATTDERYWAEYDGLQYAKHQLLTRYLGGWFPILSSWNGRVLYLDCHAGRGRHSTGHKGSPVLALQTLLEHTHRPQILASTEVHFVFFEKDQENYEYLCEEINALGQLPDNIEVHPYQAGYEAEVRQILYDLKQQRQKRTPAFAFLDPYGFTLSMDLLNELLRFPRCELLINFMYRYVDMAMKHQPQASNLNSLFGCSKWQQLTEIESYEKRTERTINLFSRQLEAEHVTHMYMKARNGVLKYALFHATNAERGRELIKEAIWNVTPDGSFTAFEHHHPDQPVLVTPEPNLDPLKEQLRNRFAGRQVPLEEIYKWLLDRLYRKKHLHEVLREWRNNDEIECTGYKGRFAFEKNPLVHIPSPAEQLDLFS